MFSLLVNFSSNAFALNPHARLRFRKGRRKLFLFMHELNVIAEDGSEEVGFGSQGQVFDGKIVHAAHDELEASGVEAYGKIGDALGVGAFHRIGYAEEGG